MSLCETDGTEANEHTIACVNDRQPLSLMLLAVLLLLAEFDQYIDALLLSGFNVTDRW